MAKADTSTVLPFLTWLIQGAVGPALVALPVNWAAADLSDVARRWFRRLRRSDGLSRIVRAAGSEAGLSDAEFRAVRQLLEDEQIWIEVGHGTVEDLARSIASCLQDHAGAEALTIGRAVALGLLEFTVSDLELGLFNQVLSARLDRLEVGQASRLDEAMLGVHADLAARFAEHEAADALRAAQVTVQLARVLDRLPPGPAGLAEIELYLATLARWLNADPWPRDRRFAGEVLTPAVIERKLRLTDTEEPTGRDFDADELSRSCRRLVVLGGPGSGKTWLARRIAMVCAENTLAALTGGADLDEVELPLFTAFPRRRRVSRPGHDHGTSVPPPEGEDLSRHTPQAEPGSAGDGQDQTPTAATGPVWSQS